jgi:hypothetical protein
MSDRAILGCLVVAFLLICLVVYGFMVPGSPIYMG